MTSPTHTLVPVATLDAHDGTAWGVAWSPSGECQCVGGGGHRLGLRACVLSMPLQNKARAGWEDGRSV